MDLDGTTLHGGRLQSRTAFNLAVGAYELRFSLANRIQTNTVNVSLGSVYSESFVMSADQSSFTPVTRRIDVASLTTANLVFEDTGNDNIGICLDAVTLTPLSRVTLPAMLTIGLISTLLVLALLGVIGRMCWFLWQRFRSVGHKV